MNMWCPEINGQRTSLTCIYRCKINRSCALYTKMYDQICVEFVEDKYIEKYGEPEYPVPFELIRKEKAAEKKAKLEAQKVIEKEKIAKKKEKEKLKKEKEAIKLAKVKAKEQKQAEKEKLKKGTRTRRTKAEMLADITPVIVEVIPEKIKRTRRTKAEMLSASVPEPVVVPEPPKQKRYRRTKAEMRFEEVRSCWFD